MKFIKKEFFLIETEEETFSFPGALVHWIETCIEKKYECYFAIRRSYVEIPEEIHYMTNDYIFRRFPVVYNILAGNCEGKVRQIYIEQR